MPARRAVVVGWNGNRGPPKRRVAQAAAVTTRSGAYEPRARAHRGGAAGIGGPSDLPLYRLNMMRSGYLLLAIGLAIVEWPKIVTHDGSLPLMEGVVSAMLTALSLLPILGLRHPVQMLPILLFESAWKLIWLSAFALPAALNGDVSSEMQEVISNCLLVVVVLVVVPWRYAWQRYGLADGDRWR